MLRAQLSICLPYLRQNFKRPPKWEILQRPLELSWKYKSTYNSNTRIKQRLFTFALVYPTWPQYNCILYLFTHNKMKWENWWLDRDQVDANGQISLSRVTINSWSSFSDQEGRPTRRSCVCYYFSRPRPWNELLFHILFSELWKKLHGGLTIRDNLYDLHDDLSVRCIWRLLVDDLHLRSKVSCPWLSTDLSQCQLTYRLISPSHLSHMAHLPSFKCRLRISNAEGEEHHTMYLNLWSSFLPPWWFCILH